MTTRDDEPPADAARLTAFLGEWRVEGTMSAGEFPAVVSGTWRFEPAANGWGVLGFLETEIEGMGAFEERELIGFDAEEGIIHLFSMNKFAIRDHQGGWTDANTLVVRHRGMHAGTDVAEEITIDVVAPGRMVGRVIEHADGSVVVTTDLTMERQV
jgi:hypothetical protein